MSDALAYLTARTVANRLASQAARLRRPRYLLALLLGLGWLGLVVWGQRPSANAGALPGSGLEIGGTLVVLALVAWAWLSGSDGRALVFSPAEVTFLFPAPMTRRTLVHYKLLRTQLLVLLNVAIWTLLAGRDPAAPPTALRAVAIWTLITTLALHRLGAALVRTSLAEHGRFGLRRRVVSVVAVAAAVGALAWGAYDVLPALAAAAPRGGSAFAVALGAAARHPVLAVLLWPFRLLVRPLVAHGAAAWGRAMLPALGILALHYVWVVRSDAAFEEAAAEASLARARRLATRRAGGRLFHQPARAASPPLFPLAARGWPATALLWKNLAAVLRRRRAGRALLGLLAGGTLLALLSGDPGNRIGQMAGALALTWLGFLIVLGPQWVRNDLRGDLLHADLLRSYPLPGWAIVATESAASAATLTLLQLALAVVAYLAFLRDATLELSPDERLLFLGAAGLLLAPVNYMMMLIQNGAAVLFPGWVRLGPATGGVEALGQQLLGTTALLLLVGLTLAAPLAAGLAVFQRLAPVAGPWALMPAFAAGVAVLAAEAALLVRRLGRAFERMDPAATGG